MKVDKLDPEIIRISQEFERIGNAAVKAAQEESRRLGVPNVYAINGRIYYELPSGELSLTDPYVEPDKRIPTPADAVATPDSTPSSSTLRD